MTLRIETASSNASVVLRLIGEMQPDDLDELKAQMNDTRRRIQFDLDEVTRVDVVGVRFLNSCEESGVELLNCPPYIREWMKRENARA
jgi:ABC-type transporter Mla MlaB component